MGQENEKIQIINGLSDTQKIWRFMSLGKFLDFLMTQSLYFSPPSYFVDISEGAITEPMYEKQISNLNKLPGRQQSIKKISREMPQDYLQINCWYCDNYESDALWRIYPNNEEGIGIQSTIKKLSNSLDISDLNKNERIYIGNVQYKNYNLETFDLIDSVPNNIYQYFYKQKYFQHEKELRLILATYNEKNQKTTFTRFVQDGRLIKTDIKQLVDNFIVSPNSPSWFLDTIMKLVEKLSLKISVKESAMSRLPKY